MARLRIGRRRATDELRELFWGWDPLGFGDERDLLLREYDGAVERTLELLEQDADRDDLEHDLSKWLSGVMRSPTVDGADVNLLGTAAASARIEGWWQEFLARPLDAPERTEFWATPFLGIPRVVWLFVGALLALVAGNLFSAGVVDGPVDPILELWSRFWRAAIFPAAALMGAPQLPRTNPRLLAGMILLGAVQLVSVLAVVQLSIEPTPGSDVLVVTTPTLVRYAVISALETSLWVAAFVLFTRGLRLAEAPLTRWVRPVALVTVILAAASLAVPLLSDSQPYIDSLAANLPTYGLGLLSILARLVALGAAIAYLVTGVRRRLEPRAAWLLAAAGFGTWFLQLSSIGFVGTLGQAIPAVGSVSAPLFFILANIRLPAVLGGLALGLGGAGATPQWVVALRSWWARQRGTVASPAPPS
jgi:hypothetical protein